MNDDRFDALLRHTLRKLPMPEPPAGFARQMAAQASDQPEQAGVEIWFTRLLLILATVAVIMLALPFTALAAERVTNLLAGAPWPLLLTVAFVFGGMKLLEIARSMPYAPLRRQEH